VGRLVVTHVPPWHDAEKMLAEAAQTYSGPLELAVPGKTYEV
jgi:ribonuclease BN (tRNA processing enzyme)